MADLPPRFTTDLEESLPGPPTTGGDTDQHSTTTTSTGRRWDDPPDDEPPAAPENLTTMVFVRTGTIAAYSESEILQLTFTPSDTHISAMTPKAPNWRNFHPAATAPCTLITWSATTGQRMPAPTAGPIKVSGGFAFKPGVVDMVVACPFFAPFPSSMGEYSGLACGGLPRLEVYDLGRRERRMMKRDVGIRAPVAWSGDGGYLAAVSVSEPSRVTVLQLAPKEAAATVTTVLMHHVDEITQLAFLPAWVEGGRALVSAGKDGYVRVTSLVSGRTLKKIEIGARAPASILRVAPDGKLVVTVWGRDVVLWFLETGRVHTYNLNATRQTEGWPLCVSPCCSYLLCRTEEGFDVSDVVTGKFRGDFARTGMPVTAAAFNSTGTRLAVGDFNGGLNIYEIITP